MAVSKHSEPNVISMPAAGDLSAGQFRIVYVDDNGRVALNTSNATACLGILLNKPAAIDRAARIAVNGAVVKCEAGAAISERDYIRAVTGGRGSSTVGTADEVVGLALTAASGSGVLFELLVNPARY